MSYKKLALNLLLSAFSMMVSVLIVEAVLRHYRPYSALGAGSELSWMRNNPRELTKVFTIDPVFGFRPILGNRIYNEFGTRVNGYGVEKRENVKRLLFIGDSVTQRGKIVDALRHVYGEEEFEYWNAGVESFNTVQEVNFYKKYNRVIDPDHVILTFHLNDFETTPISFYNKDKLVVYAPKTRLENINPWLFQYSYIYRILLGLAVSNEDDGREMIVQEVRDSLIDIKTLLQADAIEFTILVMPYLKPYEEWKPDEKKNKDRIVDILEELEIIYFDLFDVVLEAIQDGVEIQEKKGDFWHPSEDVSTLFAKYLHENHVF